MIKSALGFIADMNLSMHSPLAALSPAGQSGRNSLTLLQREGRLSGTRMLAFVICDLSKGGVRSMSQLSSLKLTLFIMRDGDRGEGGTLINE